nr:hypothetical protein Iba_chr12fCG5280 [Ipomoea batatas]
MFNQRGNLTFEKGKVNFIIEEVPGIVVRRKKPIDRRFKIAIGIIQLFLECRKTAIVGVQEVHDLVQCFQAFRQLCASTLRAAKPAPSYRPNASVSSSAIPSI